jgi:murein DD-endopeptidase MepM/ murein hydrolase activator NlpD
MNQARWGNGGFAARLKLVLGHISNGFSFIVAPHGTGTTVTFNLPGRLATGLLILVIAFVAGLAFVGVTYTRLAFLALETERLEAENEVLRQENAKINQMEQELALIDNMRRQIETWAGVVPGRIIDSNLTAGYTLVPGTWPRQYSYAIMRPLYAGRPPYPHGMVTPASGWISRRFISESDDRSGHPGIDIAASTGTPVRCALDGTVNCAGWDDIYGNLIVVEHSDSLSTAYGHNEKIFVKEGDHVAKGEVIATIGSTGRSTAPHLHFEVLKNRKPVDPELYVNFKGG